jgi:branched-chain amino acid transport system ATP-binding protein
MLEVTDVHAHRAAAHVLHGVSLSVRPGTAVALIGRNGMGKTTLLRTIMGLTPLSAGDIAIDGTSIADRRTHEIARRGVGVVPEGRGIFPSVSVLDNLRMGTSGRLADDRLEELLTTFPLLRDRLGARAGTLSGGQQQVLAIARALVPKPQLLLVDEFSEGIQPNLVDEIASLLRQLADGGMSLVVVEQNARLALEITDHAYVLEKGRIVVSGPSAEMARNEAELHAHLVL